MTNNIANINRVIPGLVEKLNPTKVDGNSNGEVSGENFGDMFGKLIQSVSEAQTQSHNVEEAMLAGEPVELHQVMIKAEQAGVSMDLLLEIRNKLINAYTELMRMPM